MSTCDDRDVDEGLDDRRQGVADVQRARDEPVVHQPGRPEDRRRRRERSDAERVEEVGAEAHGVVQGRRRAARLPRSAPCLRRLAPASQANTKATPIAASVRSSAFFAMADTISAMAAWGYRREPGAPVTCSLLLVPCSLFLVPCSLFLFPVPCSLFPVPCSLFPVPCSLVAPRLQPLDRPGRDRVLPQRVSRR